MTDEPQIRTTFGVQVIKHSASDSHVAWAARVSTQGESVTETQEGYAGLINFLMKNRHGTPFEHAVMTFRVHAPIFVWREIMRHRMFSYNEESGRYRKLSPVFYVPGEDRDLIQTGKPGQYEFQPGTEEQRYRTFQRLCESYSKAYLCYEEMLEDGIAREVARMCLPVSIYSSAYITGNSRALMNFLSLRVRSDDSTYPSFPMREIEMVAQRMESSWAELMPITHKAFVDNGRVCP